MVAMITQDTKVARGINQRKNITIIMTNSPILVILISINIIMKHNRKFKESWIQKIICMLILRGLISMTLIIITTIKGLLIITKQQKGIKNWDLTDRIKNIHKESKNRYTQRISQYNCRKKRENYMNLRTIISIKINSNQVIKEKFTNTRIIMKILITEIE